MVQAPGFDLCVCTKVNSHPCILPPLINNEHLQGIVVIASSSEQHRFLGNCGTVYFFRRDTPIRFVEQVGNASFREVVENLQVATNHDVALDAIRPFFGGESILVPKKMHFSAEINLDGRTLDTERVLDGFRRLIDDCLSDVGASDKTCSACGVGALLKGATDCPQCGTSTNVRGAEAPPRS